MMLACVSQGPAGLQKQSLNCYVSSSNFFGQNFASWQQKKRGCDWCKGVFWENMDPCCYIQTIGFGMSPTCSKIPKLFYFPLTCRQIWLSPLLDSSQPTYVTKLKRIKILVLVDIKTLYCFWECDRNSGCSFVYCILVSLKFWTDYHILFTLTLGS
jgi:hypothetical protein